VPSLEELKPTTAELGGQNPDYIARVQPLLPNFPTEVLGSWFSEHPTALGAYYPLGLENFRFRRERWSAGALGGEAILRKGTCLAKLFRDLDVTHRLVRTFMHRDGTWAIPPIVLDVANSVIPPEFDHSLNDERQLLKGHHRFAMAMQLDPEGSIEHDFES